jgi:hypothetical protein
VSASTSASTLVGSVDERLTDLAVAGATVRIGGDENREVNADSAGGFIAENLKPGRYSVLVVHIGYDPSRDTVLLSAGGIVTKQYHLQYRACP